MVLTSRWRKKMCSFSIFLKQVTDFFFFYHPEKHLNYLHIYQYNQIFSKYSLNYTSDLSQEQVKRILFTKIFTNLPPPLSTLHKVEEMGNSLVITKAYSLADIYCFFHWAMYLSFSRRCHWFFWHDIPFLPSEYKSWIRVYMAESFHNIT